MNIVMSIPGVAADAAQSGASDRASLHAAAALRQLQPGMEAGIVLDFGGTADLRLRRLHRIRILWDEVAIAGSGGGRPGGEGVESCSIDPADEAGAIRSISHLVAGRAVRCVCLLRADIAGDVLNIARRVAAAHGVVLVVGAPVPPTGVTLPAAGAGMAQTVFDAMLRRAGVFEVARNDVPAGNPQGADADDPARTVTTVLGRLLAPLRGANDGVSHFVRVCLPGPPSEAMGEADGRRRPFLSIVTRTQGTRLHTLADLLIALAGQDDQDFELLIMAHRLTAARLAGVQALLDDQPDRLRALSRIVAVDGGGRCRPLNEGFAAARGSYIAILDDDDLPFAHWVSTFRALAARSPGMMLRSVAVRQSVHGVTVGGRQALRAEGPLEKCYPSSFDLLDHLRVNRSPPVCLAFPRGAFHALGQRFDESLNTTEDWDFLLRVGSITGVASSPEITCIYRWWLTHESSRTVHGPEEWHENHQRIFAKMEAAPVLLPPGSASRLRYLMDFHDNTMAFGHNGQDLMLRTERETRRIDLIRQISDTVGSASWSLTAPVRLVGRILGKKPQEHSARWHLTVPELEDLLSRMRRSTSWRVSRPLRRLRGWPD